MIRLLMAVVGVVMAGCAGRVPNSGVEGRHGDRSAGMGVLALFRPGDSPDWSEVELKVIALASQAFQERFVAVARGTVSDVRYRIDHMPAGFHVYMIWSHADEDGRPLVAPPGAGVFVVEVSADLKQVRILPTA